MGRVRVMTHEHDTASIQPAGPRRVRVGVWLALILVLGLLLRGATISQILEQGQISLDDPDTVYQLWRIEATVRSGVPPRFDRFLNAPYGAEVPFPDGFDALLGWTARALCGQHASRHQVQLVSLTMVPLLGVFAIAMVFSLSRQVSGRGPALLAALLAAVLPVHLWPSHFGVVDHHVFEILLPAAAAALLLGGHQADDRRAALRGAIAGVVLALLVYLITAALLHLALVALGIGTAVLHASWRGEQSVARRLVLGAAVAGAVAAVLLLPDALSRQGFAPYAASRLPLLLTAAGGAVAGGALLVARRGFRTLLLVLLLPCAALALGLWLLLPQGFAFVLRRNLISVISESLPIWREPWAAVKLHSFALALLPLCFVDLLRRRTPAAWGVAAMGLAGLGLACLQVRFGLALAAPAAVAMANSATHLWSTRRWGWRVVLVAGSVAALAPSAVFVTRVELAAPQARALREASEWLARHSPPTGERRGRQPAPYSVLTQFPDGNYLAYFGDRPAVAGAFAYGDHARAIEDMLQIYFENSDPRPLLEQRAVRYLLLTGTASEELRRAVGVGQQTGRPYLYTQLFDHDGGAVFAASAAGGRTVYPAVGDIRLLHESPLRLPRGDGWSPVAKLFERVAGAKIVGACEGRLVRARVGVQTDQGRRFDYIGAASCRDGRFGLRWPYAGTALVQQLPSGTTRTAQVSERDIVEGRRVLLDSPAPRTGG